jgi:hypothetical protein
VFGLSVSNIEVLDFLSSLIIFCKVKLVDDAIRIYERGGVVCGGGGGGNRGFDVG